MSEVKKTECDICHKLQTPETRDKWIKATEHKPNSPNRVPGLYIGTVGELDVCSDECVKELVNRAVETARRSMKETHNPVLVEMQAAR